MSPKIFMCMRASVYVCDVCEREGERMYHLIALQKVTRYTTKYGINCISVCKFRCSSGMHNIQ